MAAFATISLLQHVQRSKSAMKRIWLAVSAVATGFGIWATHFIAMLAFQPDIATGYDVDWTLISLVSAIALTGVGLAIAVSSLSSFYHLLGGAIVGSGIAVMHYTGMIAFEIPGHIQWDYTLVAASVLLAIILAALSLRIAMSEKSAQHRYLAAIVLTVAICSHHFTGMAGTTLIIDPEIKLPANTIPTGWMAVIVAVVTTIIIFLATVGLILDRRDLRRLEEAGRMQSLADAAVEGLIVFDPESREIITVNRSFCRLAGLEAMAGSQTIFDFFPSLEHQSRLAQETALEVFLKAADGSEIPVEIIRHTIDYFGLPHEVYAVRDIRQRKDAEAEIHFLAYHDALTKLPNRRYFTKRLDAEFADNADGNQVAVLFLDLDRFKEINDLYGHLVGDAVLKYVADILNNVLGPDQMAARLGGDEFAIILPRLRAKTYAAQIAERILTYLAEPNSQLPADALVGTSIGIACFPEDARDRTSLLSHADAALYEAKLGGRGTYRFFEQSMGDKLRSRRQFEQDLRLAISRGEFALAFQPQADLKSDQIVGFEALLRWNHKTDGAIAPDIFIPIAEECGAILKIGEWVIKEACHEAASWKNHLGVSVNVSAVQLHSVNLVDTVKNCLKSSGLPAQRLELEITETALIKDIGRALAVLNKLKRLGVRIAMDDFGTGYSSLANLRSFPFDKIKVDRSLVRAVDQNEEAAAIMRAVVGLARGLRMPVLAEGVETEGELGFLRAEACDAVQGYLLGRPRPISAFAKHTHGKNSEDQSTTVFDDAKADAA